MQKTKVIFALFCMVESSLVLSDMQQPNINTNQTLEQKSAVANTLYRYKNVNFRDAYKTQLRPANQQFSKFASNSQQVQTANNNQMPVNNQQQQQFNNQQSQVPNNQVSTIHQQNQVANPAVVQGYGMQGNQPQSSVQQSQIFNNSNQFNNQQSCPTCKQIIHNNVGHNNQHNLQNRSNDIGKLNFKRTVAFGNRKKRRFR